MDYNIRERQFRLEHEVATIPNWGGCDWCETIIKDRPRIYVAKKSKVRDEILGKAQCDLFSVFPL